MITAWFNVFPLPQRRDFRDAFAFAAKAMDRGYHVLVFPEGRRTKDLETHTFEGGSGLLWTQLRCNALPVFIEGLSRIKVLHEPWFRSGLITVHVGEIVPRDPEADADKATKILEASVRALIPGGGDK
jgi:long-chain acyl-CoA synthetase